MSLMALRQDESQRLELDSHLELMDAIRGSVATLLRRSVPMASAQYFPSALDEHASTITETKR